MSIKNYITQQSYWGFDHELWFEILYPKKCQHCGIIYEMGSCSAQNPTAFGTFLFLAQRAWVCEACEDYWNEPDNEEPRAK